MGSELVIGGDPAFPDARPTEYPFIGGVHPIREFSVGENSNRNIAAGAGNADIDDGGRFTHAG
jgi:hypothetical protein